MLLPSVCAPPLPVVVGPSGATPGAPLVWRVAWLLVSPQAPKLSSLPFFLCTFAFYVVGGSPPSNTK